MNEKKCNCCEEMVPRKEIKRVKYDFGKGNFFLKLKQFFRINMFRMCDECRDPSNWETLGY